MSAYYNEIDPFAAEWLRELIKAGLIAPGDVDERSIEDVKPDDLRNYKQCHFFAGIGVWSYALRNAGWPDDRPIWTGSCPCQPFSSAGKGYGFDDERHLWPSFYWLIEQCKPSVVFGEQVASKSTGPWFDLVQTDVERMGYAFGCVPFPSAGVGAPHIRDRAYWVAESSREGLQGQRGLVGINGSEGREGAERYDSKGSLVCGMAKPDSNGREQGRQNSEAARHGHTVKPDGGAFRLGNSSSEPRKRIAGSFSGKKEESSGARREDGRHDNGYSDAGEACSASQVNGFWRDSDWLACRDGKWRPVKSGTFPLANGVTNRVGRLRGYGNAINAEAAKAFIEAYMQCKAS